MNSRRLFYTAITAGLLAALVIAVQSLPGLPARGDTTIPTDAVHLKALYAEKCSACHNLPDPVATPEGPLQWRRTVNQMLTRYQASDSISPAEAEAIVGYLVTFSPRAGGRFGRNVPLNPWDTDTLDVWTAQPSHSRIFNFEDGPLSANLTPAASGAAGPAAAWRTVSTPGLPDGTFVKETPAQPDASRFALLVNKSDGGRNFDVKVRFQILGGRVSPSVGLAFGLRDTKNYDVLRYDAGHGAVTLLKVAEPTHTVLQTTPLNTDTKLAAKTLSGWHTLRLLVKDGQVHGWLDGTKRITVADPAYAGGKIALWTQGDTVAGFDDWTADFYDSPAAAPAS